MTGVLCTIAGSGSPWILTQAVVQSGLIAYLDAGNPSSYPGTGTTWTDLTGNGNNGTLVNGPTYSPVNKGVLVLDGTNDYIDVPLNMSSTNYTVMGAARYVTVGGRTFSAKNNNWLVGQYNVGTESYFAEGWVRSGGPGDTNWRIYAATGDISGDFYSMYVNNVLMDNAGGSANGGSAGPNGFAIGSYQGTSEFSNSQIGFMLVYNRVLTAAEIQQNFNLFRGRYGL